LHEGGKTIFLAKGPRTMCVTKRKKGRRWNFQGEKRDANQKKRKSAFKN